MLFAAVARVDFPHLCLERYLVARLLSIAEIKSCLDYPGRWCLKPRSGSEILRGVLGSTPSTSFLKHLSALVSEIECRSPEPQTPPDPHITVERACDDTRSLKVYSHASKCHLFWNVSHPVNFQVWCIENHDGDRTLNCTQRNRNRFQDRQRSRPETPPEMHLACAARIDREHYTFLPNILLNITSLY